MLSEVSRLPSPRILLGERDSHEIGVQIPWHLQIRQSSGDEAVHENLELAHVY